MATYKVVDAEQLDAGLTAVANAIRAKGGTTESLDFPDEMEAAVEAIKTTPTLQNKTVTPATSPQSVTADSGYDGLDTVTVEAMPTTTQATPSISVSSSGLITASAEQSAGYVEAGTKSATKQLSTKGAATITPGTSNQTIASGLYLTGAQTIKGDANLVAANILSGKSIFGVAGSAQSGSPTASGTVQYTTDTSAVTFNLPFSPKLFVIRRTTTTANSVCAAGLSVENVNADNSFGMAIFGSNGIGALTSFWISGISYDSNNLTIRMKYDNFSSPSSIPFNGSYTWIAVG